MRKPPFLPRLPDHLTHPPMICFSILEILYFFITFPPSTSVLFLHSQFTRQNFLKSWLSPIFLSIHCAIPAHYRWASPAQPCSSHRQQHQARRAILLRQISSTFPPKPIDQSQLASDNFTMHNAPARAYLHPGTFQNTLPYHTQFFTTLRAFNTFKKHLLISLVVTLFAPNIFNKKPYNLLFKGQTHSPSPSTLLNPQIYTLPFSKIILNYFFLCNLP